MPGVVLRARGIRPAQGKGAGSAPGTGLAGHGSRDHARFGAEIAFVQFMGDGRGRKGGHFAWVFFCAEGTEAGCAHRFGQGLGRLGGPRPWFVAGVGAGRVVLDLVGAESPQAGGPIAACRGRGSATRGRRPQVFLREIVRSGLEVLLGVGGSARRSWPRAV